MKHAPGLGYWVRVVGLPLLLVLLTATLLGSHYETNDDVSITLLLRGRTAAAPVTNLHLYFHGWAAVLAGLYQLAPAVPWYGLVLYGLLTVALVLLTAVLEALLRPHVPPGPRAALLAGFLLVAALEHAQWFNYVRVPLLLGGAAVLWTACHYAGPRSRPAALLGLLLFVAAWAIRPSAAVLGAAVVAPAAWWLARPGAWRVVAGAGATALLLGLLVHVTRSPEAARYRRLDVLKSNVLDYGLYRPAHCAPAAPAVRAAVAQWAFGDSTLVNEAQLACAYSFQLRDVPPMALAKLTVLLPQLARDYAALGALNLWLLVSSGRASRRRQWLYVLGLGVLLLALGGLLKLPPRLAGPLLMLGTVGHLAAAAPAGAQGASRRSRQVLAGLLLVGGVYTGYKAWHRRQLLRATEYAHAHALQQVQRRAAGRVVVGVRLEECFKSLSPFRQYVAAGGGPWLLLTGWPTLDPSQPRLRQLLTGTRSQALALRRLQQHPGRYYLAWSPYMSAAERQRFRREWLGKSRPLPQNPPSRE
ncbi:hypothetical protein LJ737_06510 [Hymenobacter sp. 15J16-1T3B]|uniref:hypothetical protein n=1 Tax=Hymenobacter sp. 15J16-1T3B TaxID=2886941 RepID=UPI001D10301E|nr:hypothetical protein [Hymenobacter sp. 15J16-1T3B]MCC3156880.1 hypothetical protein [Hymenobacter sp. 15J16-1T3B]